MSTKPTMKWPSLSSSISSVAARDVWKTLLTLDGLSQSTIRGQCRMKGSVSEPHSDQRDHPAP